AGSGIASPWLSSMLDDKARYKDMRTGALYSVSSFLSLPTPSVGIVMHKYLVSAYTPLVFASIYTAETALRGVVVESDGRSVLAYANSVQQSLTVAVSRVIYIPIDYWEL